MTNEDLCKEAGIEFKSDIEETFLRFKNEFEESKTTLSKDELLIARFFFAEGAQFSYNWLANKLRDEQ